MKKLLFALGRMTACAMLIAAFSASAMQVAHADPRGVGHDRGHGRDWHHDPHWHGGPPPAVYAPAPVVYAPPPPSPGINLILPLNFR